jgi:hypothetical protein
MSIGVSSEVSAVTRRKWRRSHGHEFWPSRLLQWGRERAAVPSNLDSFVSVELDPFTPVLMANYITSGVDKPWHKTITIDLLVLVLQRSIFHPFVAWLLPLCQRAVGAPYESFEFRITCAYATAITLIWMLSIINKRVAYGRPREVDWDEEVVVITGGASGLGNILAETYGMRGASVAILDIQKPEKESEGLAGAQFYHCDVSDAASVEKAKDQIKSEVRPVNISTTPTQHQVSSDQPR